MPQVWQVNAKQPHSWWQCMPNCGTQCGDPNCNNCATPDAGRQWQSHYYGDLFLQYGAALIGPGGGGRWPCFTPHGMTQIQKG